jgi:hypothetical protein
MDNRVALTYKRAGLASVSVYHVQDSAQEDCLVQRLFFHPSVNLVTAVRVDGTINCDPTMSSQPQELHTQASMSSLKYLSGD